LIVPRWNKSRRLSTRHQSQLSLQMPICIKNSARNAGKFGRHAVKSCRFHRHNFPYKPTNFATETSLMLQIVLTANFGTSPLLSSYLALIHAPLFTRRSLWPQSKAAFQINIAARIH
jgi:hypothetical protein